MSPKRLINKLRLCKQYPSGASLERDKKFYASLSEDSKRNVYTVVDNVATSRKDYDANRFYNLLTGEVFNLDTREPIQILTDEG